MCERCNDKTLGTTHGKIRWRAFRPSEPNYLARVTTTLQSSNSWCLKSVIFESRKKNKTFVVICKRDEKLGKRKLATFRTQSSVLLNSLRQDPCSSCLLFLCFHKPGLYWQESSVRRYQTDSCIPPFPGVCLGKYSRLDSGGDYTSHSSENHPCSCKSWGILKKEKIAQF